MDALMNGGHAMESKPRNKSERKLNYIDATKIDLICRQSVKLFLQNLTPEKLREIFVNPKYSLKKPLPKNFRLENLVEKEVQQNVERHKDDWTRVFKPRFKRLPAVAPARLPSQSSQQQVSITKLILPNDVALKKQSRQSKAGAAALRTFPKKPSQSIKSGKRSKPPMRRAGPSSLVSAVQLRGGRNLTVSAGDLPSSKPAGSFRCEWPGCDKIRASRVSIRAHMNIHLQVYKCKHCGASFQCATHMLDHIKSVHCALKPFECLICHEAFKLRSKLAKHSKYRHSCEQRPFKCPDCGKSTWKRYNLFDHRVRVHNWDWRNEPSVCDIKLDLFRGITVSLHEKCQLPCKLFAK